MRWIAPTERDANNATLEKRLWEAADQFRASIEELFEDGAPDYDAEMRDFLVSSLWRNLGDVVKHEDRLYAKHIKSHLAALDEASRRRINNADKVAAQDTFAGISVADRPKLSDIATCIDVIEEIAKNYIAALTGAGYGSLSPVAQFDGFDVFAFHGCQVPMGQGRMKVWFSAACTQAGP